MAYMRLRTANKTGGNELVLLLVISQFAAFYLFD